MSTLSWYCTLILRALRERTVHENYHRRGFACPEPGCDVISTSAYQQQCHAKLHRTGLPYPCRLGCKEKWFRLASQQADHHLYDHGTRFGDQARARHHNPRLHTGSFDVPPLLKRTERPCRNRDGEKRPCINCKRELSAHWHTFVPGESAQCSPCGDFWNRVGQFRRVDQPVRGRDLPPDREEVKEAPCEGCDQKPGPYPHWGRGPAGEILCPTCRRCCELESPPKLVPRVCGNPVCATERGPAWSQERCPPCYNYRYSKDVERPKRVVDR